MLKLPSRARYALKSMVALVRLSTDSKPVSLAMIAKRTNVSKGYLEQVAIQLKNASLIKGVSGKGGGYVMTRPPMDIKVGEVIEAVIGPINVVECVRRPEACLITDMCECREVYVLINRKILSALYSFSIADLARIGPGNDCAHHVDTDGDDDFFARIVPGGSPCMSK